VFFYARRKKIKGGKENGGEENKEFFIQFYVIFILKAERRILSVSLMESSCLI